MIATATPTISMVSFAVSPEEALLLHGASSRSCNLRLVLRNNTDAPTTKKKWTEAELWAMLADRPVDDESPRGEGEGAVKSEKPKVETVKLAVAKVEIAAGTKLTKDVIDKQFEMQEFAKPIPANGVQDIRDYTGQYLLKELAPNQLLPQSFIGEKPTDKPDQQRKLPPESDATPKENTQEPEKPKVSEPPPVYQDYTVQTPNSVKKHRYQVFPNGEYKYLGEVPFDGRPEKVKPAEKAEDKKPDAKSGSETKPSDKTPGKEGKKDGEKIGEAV